MQVGQKVLCNGYEGTISAVLTGQLTGMVEVRLPGGLVCVDVTTIKAI
jgi:molybdopterin-binding protein